MKGVDGMVQLSKRVLIIVENLPIPNDRRVWLEAKALRDAGCKVSVISIKGKNATKSHEVLEKISIFRYSAPHQTKGTLSFIREFSYCWINSFLLSIRIFLKDGVDVIHACNPPETFWLIGLIFKLFRKKFVFDHHDLSPEMYFSRFGRKGIAYKMLLLLERLTFLTADAVITTNETHKKIAIERGKFPEEKIFIVRSGPDNNLFENLIANNKKSARNNSKQVVSYLGIINPQDGVDTLIQIAKYIVHTLNKRNIEFVIMGSGDAEQDLHKMVRQLNMDDYVKFTGWVEPDVMVEQLLNTDVCVDTMPKNSYSDGSTLNKILEYMAAGRPIVCFDLVETRISAGDAAIYAVPDNIVDFSHKLLTLLEDESARIRMGELGQKRIKESLAWEHQQKNLLSAYHSLFQNS